MPPPLERGLPRRPEMPLSTRAQRGLLCQPSTLPLPHSAAMTHSVARSAVTLGRARSLRIASASSSASRAPASASRPQSSAPMPAQSVRQPGPAPGNRLPTARQPASMLRAPPATSPGGPLHEVGRRWPPSAAAAPARSRRCAAREQSRPGAAAPAPAPGPRRRRRHELSEPQHVPFRGLERRDLERADGWHGHVFHYGSVAGLVALACATNPGSCPPPVFKG